MPESAGVGPSYRRQVICSHREVDDGTANGREVTPCVCLCVVCVCVAVYAVPAVQCCLLRDSCFAIGNTPRLTPSSGVFPGSAAAEPNKIMFIIYFTALFIIYITWLLSVPKESRSVPDAALHRSEAEREGKIRAATRL